MPPRPLMLDLYSGSAGASQPFADRGWEVITVDLHAKATEQADVRRWSWQGRTPDFVWASPPCEQAVSRRVHVAVVAQLDGAGRAQRGRLSIDRVARLVLVRPHRRRRVYAMSLDAVAQLVVSRVIEAELRELRRMRKARRSR